ncbi:unnamed protein product [Timema podura]|uniref:Uncharacterized protein n=1 Tax=Timema podura TaxID=61482 RepID=A0ABN7PI08_TIMPD|nr:unnamed protein product [Timema podura]
MKVVVITRKVKKLKRNKET